MSVSTQLEDLEAANRDEWSMDVFCVWAGGGAVEQMHRVRRKRTDCVFDCVSVLRP